MRVILKKDIPSLGRAGDIKKVKNGYARNYLIPYNLAMLANARSEKQAKFIEKVQASKIQKRKKTAQEAAEQIKNKEIRITMKVGEGKLFGSVTNLHVQRELEKIGFIIDKKNIQIDEPIKTLGSFDIPLKFYEGINSQVKLIVQDENGNTQIPSKSLETQMPETTEESQELEKSEDSKEIQKVENSSSSEN